MHRTAAKYEAINLVLIGTLEYGLLASAEIRSDLPDASLGESGGPTHTTGGEGRYFFKLALSENSE